jgi:hypothetical protein
MTTKEHSEATAAAELERAEQGVREVLERIKDADEKIGPEALEAAERRVRFCEARLEGARRREAEEAEEERLRSLADVAELTQDRVKAAGVQKARKAAEKALETYVAACMAHNEAVDEAAGVFLSQRDLPRGYAVDMGRDGHSIVLGSGTIRRVRPMVEVRDMGLEVLGRHLRGGYISLGDDAY